MAPRDTVLVLGAGTSVEFGIPAGNGLADRIAERLTYSFDDFNRVSYGDRQLSRAFSDRARQAQESLRPYFDAASVISRGIGLSHSIDDFLYNHGDSPHVVALGKAAIALSILDAERGSKIYRLDRGDEEQKFSAFKALNDTWIYKLFRYLTTDVKKSDVRDIFKRLTIINFNYDRCIEVFFSKALQYAYAISATEASEIVATLDISHAYGTPGWLSPRPGQPTAVGFGAETEAYDPFSLADNLQTYTEQIVDNAMLENWHQKILGSRRIVFLGFAYHKQNMALLALGGDQTRSMQIYGTAYGTSSQDQQVFSSRIEAAFRPHIGPTLFPGDCSTFVATYGQMLF